MHLARPEPPCASGSLSEPAGLCGPPRKGSPWLWASYRAPPHPLPGHAPGVARPSASFPLVAVTPFSFCLHGENRSSRPFTGSSHLAWRPPASTPNQGTNGGFFGRSKSLCSQSPLAKPLPTVTFAGGAILIHPVPTLAGRAGKGALRVETEARGARGPDGTLVDI